MLVITIIIMIILATVIITALGDSDLITQANTAVKKTNQKNMEEAANIALGDLLLENSTSTSGSTTEITAAAIEAKMEANGVPKDEIDKYTITYTADGKLTVSLKDTSNSNSSSTAWNGDVSSSIEVDSQDTDVYNIYTAAELAYVAFEVNNGNNDFFGKTIKLMNDIDFGATWDNDGILTTGKVWTGIGKYITDDNTYLFMGDFDGNGKTIKNIYCKNDDISAPGGETSVYFSGIINVAYGSTISNLTVKDSCVIGTQVGAIVGAGDSVTITNCHNKDTDIYATRGVTDVSFAGGIAGSIPNANISNCTNTGKITSVNIACGIIGLVRDDYSVTDCTNTGDLIGPNTEDIYEES